LGRSVCYLTNIGPIGCHHVEILLAVRLHRARHLLTAWRPHRLHRRARWVARVELSQIGAACGHDVEVVVSSEYDGRSVGRPRWVEIPDGALRQWTVGEPRHRTVADVDDIDGGALLAVLASSERDRDAVWRPGERGDE